MTTAYELTGCIVCGSRSSREVADADAVRDEVEQLWAFHGRRLRDAVPPEHLMDRVAFSQHAPLRVVQCCDCGLVYRNPIERAQEMIAIYREAGPTREVLQSLHATQARSYKAQARRLTRLAGNRGTVIEVGSYVGAFLAAARESGWDCIGVDVNTHTNAFTRSLGFHVHDGPLETLRARPASAIAIWNCLDQLVDPAGTIRSARARIARGGVLALRVPNGACYAALRPALGGPLGPAVRGWLAQNNLLGFPYRFGFTPAALDTLVSGLGFEVVQVTGDVLVPTGDRWTRRWARVEERLGKWLGRLASRVGGSERPLAPWFELYARAV